MAQDIKVENLGGSSPEAIGGFNHRKILIALASWFTTISAPKPLHDADTPANEGTNFAELATITANHVFKSGYGFITVEGVQETTDLTSAGIGNKKNRLFENKQIAVLAGSDAELLGFSRWVKNQDLVILTQEVGTSNYRQLGSDTFAASVSEFEGKIEAALEGGNTQTYTLSDKQVYQAPIYAGTVDLMPAQV